MGGIPESLRQRATQLGTAMTSADKISPCSLVKVPVTCDGGLEGMDGSLPREGTVKTRIMQIRRGIFQGDSLSPLLFCMALNPLSTELNRTGYGYWVSTGHGRTAKVGLPSVSPSLIHCIWMI